MKLFLDTNIHKKNTLKFGYNNKFKFKVLGNNKKNDSIKSESSLVIDNEFDHNGGLSIIKFVRRRKIIHIHQGNYNTGRWTDIEHRRLIEAIFKFGTKWGSIVKYIGTRSRTQARSRTQKFFLKLKKYNVFNLDFDIDTHWLISYYNKLSNEDKSFLIEYLSNFEFANEEPNCNSENAPLSIRKEDQCISGGNLISNAEETKSIQNIELNDANEINYLSELALSQYQNLDNFLNNIIQNNGNMDDLIKNQDLILVIEELMKSNQALCD